MSTRNIPQSRGSKLALLAAVTAAASLAFAVVPVAGPAHAETTAGTAHVETTGTHYYVSTDGNDSNSGTSPDAAWKSLDKVNATTFRPGDTISLDDGGTWTGQLWPKGSGVNGSVITLNSYGTGAMPKIEGQGKVGDAVQLLNQQYWTISGLDVSNAVPATSTPGANLGDFRGIGIHGNNGTVLHDITVDGVYVHDVTGEINWIGGSSTDTPGVHWNTGWDRSKNTAGIVVNASVANIAAPGNPTTFDGVTIENSRVENTSFAGISTKQYTGDAPGAVSTGWGERTSTNDPKFTPFTNVMIQNNYITQANTAFGGDGVYLTDVRGGVVQNNVIDQVGASGVESYMTDNVTVQYNEVMNTHYVQGSADANGLDPDIGTTNQVFQYNYLHDNADGILMCACGAPKFGSATVRYNVVANSANRNIYFSQGAGSTAQVYNNVFYNKTAPNMTSGSISGTVKMTNNIFASQRSDASFISPSGLTYINNGYTSNETGIPSSDTAAVKTADPRFVKPSPTGPYGSTGGTQLATAGGYALQPGSAFIDAGATVANNGGKDFAGSPVPTAQTDIGAFEYHTPAGQTTESVTGTIVNQYGSSVSGATVSVTAGGVTKSATSDSSGFYVVSKVPFFIGAALTATAPEYADYHATLTVADGTPTRQNFTMNTTSTTGTVTGQVADEQGNPVPGATVTLSGGDQKVRTVKSGNDGRFTIGKVQAGGTYALSAAVLGYGYGGIARDGFTITPTQVRDIGTLYVTNGKSEALVSDDFNALPTGPLADGTDGWHVVSTGNAVNVAQVPSATDKSAYLKRTTTNSASDGTNLSRVFSTPVSGLVTVEASIMRNDTEAGYFGTPYIYNANGTQAVSVAFEHGSIQAYAGGVLKTLGTYNTGQWYDVKLVVDTLNQSYDLYLDGRQLLSDAAFRTSMPSIGRIAWYANGGERGSVYLDNVAISSGAKYTAVPLNYSIKYDLAAGTVKGSNPVTYTIQSGDITLTNPTRYAYTFAGWTGTDLTGPTKRVTIPAGSIGDRKYTATWAKAAPSWSADTSYSKPGTTVFYDGRLYKNAWYAKGDKPGSSATGAWEEVGAPTATTPGTFSAWTASWIYNGGETVAYDGRAYRAAWYTRNQAPGNPDGPWQEEGSAVKTTSGTFDTWTASWIYNGGETVAYQGHLWKAKYYSRNQKPGSDGSWQDLGTYAEK